ncbi:MAG: indole-3-glycerol phosphate synthase TrpC [Deferribacteraceae bacterium]|jgi:indole-3-glycerol phosphate synthase|nr:indole-3-glycerol phosphate synthase TrpC [Deferribacteraceae bacterium]
MTILDTIAAASKKRIEAQKEAVTLETVRKEALALSAARRLDSGVDIGFPFEKALAASGMSFICEAKKASPTIGVLEENFDYLRIAKDYEKAGAAAISVLTEPEYFMGSPLYLKEISAAVQIPTLRKDFIIDPYQVYEARSLGAGAVLLICALLGEKVGEYIELAHSLGLSALVEAHTAEEVHMALAADAHIIGVNNRDLKSFKVNFETSISLRKLVPQDRLFVSESGIRTRQDIIKLENAGVNAVLIGETLMRSADRKAALSELKGL